MNQPHNNSIQGPPKAGEPGTTKPLKTQGRRRETLQENSDGEHLFTYIKTFYECFPGGGTNRYARWDELRIPGPRRCYSSK